MIFEPQLIVLGECVAAVDVITGAAELALPRWDLDRIFDPFGTSPAETLRQAEIESACARLLDLGIEALPPWLEEASSCLLDGREVWSARVVDPVNDEVSLEELAQAFDAVRERLHTATADRN